jgi:hypothetical protein
MAADLRFDCDSNAPPKNILSKEGQQVRKQTNYTIAIPRCALTWFHAESITRVSRRAPFQVKECAIANALVFS